MLFHVLGMFELDECIFTLYAIGFNVPESCKNRIGFGIVKITFPLCFCKSVI